MATLAQDPQWGGRRGLPPWQTHTSISSSSALIWSPALSTPSGDPAKPNTNPSSAPWLSRTTVSPVNPDLQNLILSQVSSQAPCSWWQSILCRAKPQSIDTKTATNCEHSEILPLFYPAQHFPSPGHQQAWSLAFSLVSLHAHHNVCDRKEQSTGLTTSDVRSFEHSPSEAAQGKPVISISNACQG